MTTRRSALKSGVAGLLGTAFGTTGLARLLGLDVAAGAAEPPVEINWASLMPAPAANARPAKPAWLQGAQPRGEGYQPPPPEQEGKWMSQRRGNLSEPPAVVKELDGKRVQIGGYVVPLDFEATTVKEFLLVPYVGACIHIPPPPANQIIYVKAEKGFEIKGAFDPVYVTGTLKTAFASTGLADTGYSLDADKVESRKP